jgi:hypothetical protein
MEMIKFVAIVFLFTTLSLNANGQLGPYFSFESYNYPGEFIRHANGLGEITTISTTLDQKDATFSIVPGLADSSRISLESYNYPGSYLRHQDGRIKLHEAASDRLYKEDATFRIVPGLADSSAVSFESYNYPGYYIRHRDGHLWVEINDKSQLFIEDATFRIVAPKFAI